MLVRAIRGEEVQEDWRYFVSTAATMAAFALKSGAHIRQAEALRVAVAELHEIEREVAEDARRRDERAAKLQEGLNRLTKTLVVLVAMTLVASIVAVVVAIVGV
jgi:hypothetical protein